MILVGDKGDWSDSGYILKEEQTRFADGGVHAKSLQSCLTLCNPMDCSPPGSSVRGILQECWSGLPCPPPEGLPDPGVESRSLTLWEDSLLSEPPGKPADGGYKLKRGVTDYSRISGLDN